MSPVVESRLWTSDEEERLRALVVSGKHPAAIGKLLGRSEKAIRNRLHRLGVPTKRIHVGPKAKGK
jgi:ParB-like chromosome segregation protein Spo0J